MTRIDRLVVMQQDSHRSGTGMGLLTWFRGASLPKHRRTHEWRTACASIAVQPDDERLRSLEQELRSWGHNHEDVEIEHEMLQGVRDVAELQAAVGASGLPLVETGHRVVGTDMCHFTAPASMPDEEGQPSGRVLFTNDRAIFVGGARGTALAWHSIGRALLAERDVVLVRGDREQAYRFRCNSFSDAYRGAFIARQLIAARHGRHGL